MLHNKKTNPTKLLTEKTSLKNKLSESGSYNNSDETKENIKELREEFIAKVERKGAKEAEHHTKEEKSEGDNSTLIECEKLQRKELEALKLIYVRDNELTIQNENDKNNDTVIHMLLKDENMNDNVIKLIFELPKDYPLNSFLLININVKNFTPDMNSYINQEIYKEMQNYIEQENSILNIIYRVNELVENIQNNNGSILGCSNSSSDEREENTGGIEEGEEEEVQVRRDMLEAQTSLDHSEEHLINNNFAFLYCNKMSHFHHRKVLARRLCYSHHILSLVKRTYIIKWAKELKIGGYSKIGYPGIIICEGSKDEVDFYINSLNKLRWKHFDCRGMEDIVLNEYDDLDDARVLPRTMYELDSKGMRTLSNICTECGLRDLFLTSMKIYKSGEKNSTADQGKSANINSKEKNKKKKKK
ncbi:hypothetical protein, conserved [Plasmodium gonderi]|uniref:RWD domain-containing protein n=1 Tax=Plasmodium gonderi TaxID=77519 RepID=A0A1Y1JKH8_PLAGO|nr:hypothetical protein, conserved [Plasmodium gonderi]GAW81697.1 hypothetical protein, conserved [Plasmodium gonderi]